MNQQTYLLDTSFMVDLADEKAARKNGPARRALAAFAKSPLYISPVTVAEFLETVKNRHATLAALMGYGWHTIGDAVAQRCALNQKRSAREGRRMGENDAWQAAIAMAHDHTLVGCDEAFENRPWLKYIDHREKFGK